MVTGSPRPMLVGRELRFAEGVNFDQDGTLYCVTDWAAGSGASRPEVHSPKGCAPAH
jgi:hypothetical protein